MGKIERVCQHCGKTFLIYESVLSGKTNSSGKFCCRKCYNEYQKTLTGARNNHYTSISINCANCGKEIKIIPSRQKIYKNAFCSVSCKSAYHHNYVQGEKNHNWKGGVATRGDFEVVKTALFKNAKCAICGDEKSPHIHHIIPYKFTQDNDPDNLIPLCRKHHTQVERFTQKLFEKNKSHEEIRIAVLKTIAERREMVESRND